MNVVSSQTSPSQALASNSTKSDALSFYYLLFFLSGFPALLYQIVWQRALFTLYGVNVESVTMIVTVFMLGLGLGSLAGGRLSTLRKIKPLLAFGLIEVSIGTFGAASLWIFHRMGALTAGHSTAVTGLIAFALLLFPTLLMGSTLPLLVEHIVRRTGNVGESVGSLYSVNTFGSGVACLAAAQELATYEIDGHPVFDLSNSVQRKRFEEVLQQPDESNGPNGIYESRDSMLKRLANAPLITDDNMGTEWK